MVSAERGLAAAGCCCTDVEEDLRILTTFDTRLDSKLDVLSKNQYKETRLQTRSPSKKKR